MRACIKVSWNALMAKISLKQVWEYGSMGVCRQTSSVRACEYIYATAEKTPISDYPVYKQRSSALQFPFYSIPVVRKVYRTVLLFPRKIQPIQNPRDGKSLLLIHLHFQSDQEG